MNGILDAALEPLFVKRMARLPHFFYELRSLTGQRCKDV